MVSLLLFPSLTHFRGTEEEGDRAARSGSMPPRRVKFSTPQLPEGYQLREADQMKASGLDLSNNTVDICRRIGIPSFTLLAT
jgi:hypothetical protein